MMMRSTKLGLAIWAGIMVGGMMGALGTAFAGDLALKRVMLSEGGVGYFEYQAEVDGTQTLALTLPRDQMDDVLKSLVVFDNKGKVGTIQVPGENPLAESFRHFPFGQAALSSPAALLNALQGQTVSVTGPKNLTGKVIRAETVQTKDTTGTVATLQTRVSLMTEKGLQQFVLEEVESLTFPDKKLDGQVREALDLIAASNRSEQRRLEITSAGKGKRTVTVGFVMEMPLWKTSYRLTVDQGTQKGSTTGYLQGWAVLENMSGQDWHNVDLTLASGNPVTFRQAIYQSYYVNRPEVPVDLLDRVAPTMDKGAVSKRYSDMAASAIQTARPMVNAVAEGASSVSALKALAQVNFQFSQPVSVKAGNSLVVPIIGRDVPVTQIALYQPASTGDHPMMAIDVTNNTGTGLPPGAVAVYGRASGDSGVSYLGDALSSALPKGEHRMLAFAVDGSTKVDKEQRGDSYVANGHISGGVLRYSRVHRLTTLYRLKAPADEGRNLVIEQSRQAGYDLTAPRGSGIRLTADMYRIPVDLKAGEEKSLSVVLERPLLETTKVTNLKAADFAAYITGGHLDRKVIDALKKIRSLKVDVNTGEQAVARLQASQKALFDDQARLRDNLGKVPKDSSLYQRYMGKLSAQEDQVEGVQKDLAAAQGRLVSARKALDSYIGGLEI